jgi:hypothetical protein
MRTIYICLCLLVLAGYSFGQGYGGGAAAAGGASDHGELTGLDDPTDHSWAGVLTSNQTWSGSNTFTNVTIGSGATVEEFSTDTTLAGNSDAAVPTEKVLRSGIHNIDYLWINPMAIEPTVGQGTWGQTQSSADLYAFTVQNSASAADGDNITFAFNCPAGTYTLKTFAITAANQGIVDVYIDNVEVGSSDRYSAATVRRAPFSITNVTLAAGAHTIKYQEDGKNGASSAYRFVTQGTWLIRE